MMHPLRTKEQRDMPAASGKVVEALLLKHPNAMSEDFISMTYVGHLKELRIQKVDKTFWIYQQVPGTVYNEAWSAYLAGTLDNFITANVEGKYIRLAMWTLPPRRPPHT